MFDQIDNKMTLVQPDLEMQVKIREELNEDVNTRDVALQNVKDWLSRQPHLPNTDDHHIMAFLRACKFSLEKTKKRLDKYHSMRSAIPEFFSNRDVTRPELQEIMRAVHLSPLPVLTPSGRRVVCWGIINKKLYPKFEDCMKLVIMIGDARIIQMEEFGVAGDVYIMDASFVSVKHLRGLTPSLLIKFFTSITEACPVRLAEVHVINIHPLIDKIFNFVKPFMKDKIKNRVFMHRDGLKSLHKYVPIEVLPEELGGTLGSMQYFQDQWIKKLEEFTPWFKAQEENKVDELKRPGKPTNYDELFGVVGSFKTLSVD